MFTGIVAHLGKVRSVQADPRGGATLRVSAPAAIAEGVAPKDSICVNGVCLTVVSRDDETATFDVVPETLGRSNLGTLRAGDRVNLELSLRVGDRLGGHLVYGHVDATVAIRSKVPEGQGYRIFVSRPPELTRCVVEKGCVALDGVSLTVASVGPEHFEVAVIPETASRTTLGTKVSGSLLNLEIDPIARYAVDAAAAYEDAGAATSDELAWAYEI
jgi:riboflavin synthase